MYYSIEEAVYENCIKSVKQYYNQDPDCILYNFEIVEYSIMNKNLPMLKFLVKNGAPTGSYATAKCAHYGFLRGLVFLLEYGSNSDSLTTYCAAKSGHLDCLIYALSKDVPLDKNALEKAVYHNHLKVVVYICEKIGYWDPEIIKIAQQKNNKEMIQYVQSYAFKREVEELILDINSIQLDEISDLVNKFDNLAY